MVKTQKQKDALLNKVISELDENIVIGTARFIESKTTGICSRQIVVLIGYLIDKGIIKG